METDVLIVGGGFGGATAAKRLEKLLASSAERVQLVAPENFLLFAPLMPGMARKARVFTDWTISTAFPRDLAQLGALGRPFPLE